MKSFTVILFLGLSVLAADQQPTTTEQRTTNGASWIVSVGHCSFPLKGYGTVASNFAYSACQEYITADYEVSGSSWNKDYRLISGTEKKSYGLVQNQNGHSTFVSEEDVDLFDVLGVQTACNSIRSATVGSLVHVSQTPCGQSK